MAVVNAGRERIARLLQLILALGAGRCPNARELAGVCEVSRRTIYRDLEVLELAGVPVRYRSDRQGYELPPGYSFAPPALEEAEAAALLLLAGQLGDALGLASAARSAARKVFLTLPGEVRERVRGLLDSAGSPAPCPPPAPDRQAVYDAILQAMGRGLQVRAWYSGDDGATADVTKLSPYRLACGPLADWTVVGRSSLHRGVRTFAMARILRAELTGDLYEIPPRYAPAREVNPPCEPIRETGPLSGEVRLRLSRRVASVIPGSTGRSFREIEWLEDGGAVVGLDAASLDDALARVIAMGDQVEVLAPPELRARLAEVAGRVARMHSAPGTMRTPPPPPGDSTAVPALVGVLGIPELALGGGAESPAGRVGG